MSSATSLSASRAMIRPAFGKSREPAFQFVRAAGLMLAGYAIAGKGFAYIGVAPIFIGELMLLAGVIVALRTPGVRQVLCVGPAWWCIAFMAWGAMQTVPYLGSDGLNALRGGMIWFWGSWALLLGGLLIARPYLLPWLARHYRHFAAAFLILLPLIWCLQYVAGEMIPRWPGTDVPIVMAKGGDAMVHLTGIVACTVAGFWPGIAWYWMALMPVTFLLGSTINRGGMLSFFGGSALALVLRPASRRVWRLITALGLAILLLGLFDVRSNLTRGGREISFEQIVQNVASVVGYSDGEGLEGTKEWRQNWWRDIWDYTVHGEWFWTGKGFAVNLADDDGYQVTSDHSLRDPHSIHFSILARSGVPGLLLWIVLQISWGYCVFDRFYRAARARQSAWAGLFTVLLALWIAMLINASFDVFLEGPMGGIWFWCVVGIGIAAIHLHRHCPDLLQPATHAAGL